MVDESALRKHYTSLAIISVFVIASTFAYAFIVDVVDEQNAPFAGFVPDFANMDALRLSLLGLSVIMLFFMGRLKKFLLHGIPLPTATANPTLPYEKLPASVRRFNQATIFSLALCEAICIFGLVLFLIGGNKTVFYTFMPLSLVGFGYNFPKYKKMKAYVNGEPDSEDDEHGEHGQRDYKKAKLIRK